jgi:hypothetical protein
MEALRRAGFTLTASESSRISTATDASVILVASASAGTATGDKVRR